MTDVPQGDGSSQDASSSDDPVLPGSAPRSTAPAPAKPRWGCLASPWALGCFGLFGIFLVAILAIWILNGRDIDPPDLSDLEITLAPVPAAANAFTYIMNGRGRLVPADPGGQVDDLLLSSWQNIARGQPPDPAHPWDDAVVSALLAANTAALEDLEAAAQAPHAQLPQLDFNAPIPGLQELRQLSNLAFARAEQRRRAGDHAGARDSAMQVVRLCNKLQTGTGSLIIHMIATAIATPALSTVRHVLADPDCPADVCDETAAQLAALAPIGPGLARTFRCEFTMAAAFMDTTTTPGQITALGAGNAGLPALLDRGPGFFFHPNRTKALLAKDFRTLVANATTLPSQVIPPPPAPTFSGFVGTVRLVGGGNAVGRIMHAMVVPGLARTVQSRADGEAALGCTTVYARALAWLRRTGERPATLTELSGVVPADPYTGTPLRYDPKTGVIWSVGKNGTDEGGDVLGDADPALWGMAWNFAAPDAGLTLPPK